jgi:hypothetical protein
MWQLMRHNGASHCAIDAADHETAHVAATIQTDE